MKKRVKALVMGIILILSMAVNSVVFAEDNITVKLNGKTLLFDVQPQIINGRTMVPMRAIFEELGATVAWEQETQTITSVKGDTTIKLTIGIPKISINQQISRELDTAPCIINGRTLVPVRAISEAFDMNVEWDDVTQSVLITSNNTNITAYSKLKNIILTEGYYSEIYSIIYRSSDTKNAIMLSYDPTYEFITLYHKYEGSAETSTMISIYPDMRDPSLLFIFKNSYYGIQYDLLASYPKAYQPFIERSNTFPTNIPPYEALNTSLTVIDIVMSELVNMSLYDFGICY